MKSILIFSLIIAVFISCRADDIEVKMQEILDDLLNPTSYDKRIRPGREGSTTEVNVTVSIIDIPKVDPLLKDYTIQMYFRQTWVDKRLRFADRDKRIKSIYVTEPEKVWTPDLLFMNEVKEETQGLRLRNAFLILTPEGSIVYSVRYTVTFSCDTELKYYPHDQQMCAIETGSYTYLAGEIKYQWESDSPVTVNEHVKSNSKFLLLDHKETVHTLVINEKEYTVLTLKMLFSRNFSFFLQTTYIPSIILVMISWGSFWLDTKQIIPRLSFVILIMCFMMFLILEPALLPHQVTAMDVWEGSCMTFLFAAFLELIVVNQMARWDEAKKTESEQSEIRDAESGNMKEEKPDKGDRSTRGSKILQKFMKGHQTRSSRVDAICRIVFPFLFLLFNLIYWPVCYSSLKNTVEEWDDGDM